MRYKIRRIIKAGNLPSTWFNYLHGRLNLFSGANVSIDCDTDRTFIVTSGSADNGLRAFAGILSDNLEDCRFAFGSWGGPTPFEHRIINNFTWHLPLDGAVVTGETSGPNPISVHLDVSPYTLVKMFASDNPGFAVAKDSLEENGGIPTAQTNQILENIIGEVFFTNTEDPLTPIERQVMYAYGCIKSGKYRQDELAKVADQPTITQTIAGLFIKKYLKASKNGAITMTLAGKNTRKAMAGSGKW
jgi:hypothetical protein